MDDRVPFDQEILHAIILAGGTGTRLWPLSTAGRPKQFLDLTGSGRTMLQSTVGLLEGLVPIERTIVVTGERHADLVRVQLPELPQANLLIEPRSLNTAPAMAVATALIRSRRPDAVVVNLPSDHHVGSAAMFRRVVTAAATAAAERPVIVVAGVMPTSAHTGFGYIEVGDVHLEVGDLQVRRAVSFTEKPDRRLAQTFVESGQYLWNANYYTFRLDTFEAGLVAHAPLLAGLVWPTGDATGCSAFLEEVYARAEPTSIDCALTRWARNICVVPAEFDWSDLGTWEHLYAALAAGADETDNVVATPDKRFFVTMDSRRNLVVQTTPRAIALVGVTDSIVVDTDDALLVARRGDLQHVRALATRLAELHERFR